MLFRCAVGAAALLAAQTLPIAVAGAVDGTKYPDWKGQWVRAGSGQGVAWDPTKPWGRGQQAPLTPEYHAVFEANLADLKAGGPGADPGYRCIPNGMPRIMLAVQPMEIVITPETTYVFLELFGTVRRIYTDGRAWPAHIESSFSGYSVGRWEDTDDNGRYDTLHVETRGLKGGRTYDGSGLPFHKDGKTVITERISFDPAQPGILQNVITSHDNALTRPWTVTRSYRRVPDKRPVWSEYICEAHNHHVEIGDQNYMISGDGFLMPARKGQPPPDLRHFQPLEIPTGSVR